MDDPFSAQWILEALDRRRLELGLTQTEVTKRALGHDNADLFQKLRRGSVPSAARLKAACDALDLELYLGPPRSEPPGPKAPPAPAPRPIADALGLPLDDLERSTQSLVRLTTDAGGDPIPEDLWPVLDERRGFAAIPVLTESAGDARPEGGVFAAGGDVLMVMFAEDVRAAAGTGEMVFEEAVDMRVAVPRAILPGWVRPEGLACIQVAGDSMEPGLSDGDMILLDRSHAEPTDGEVFVLHTVDGLVVKRLREVEGEWEMASDNPAYPPRPAGEWDRPVGRLAWSGPLPAIEARAGPVTNSVVDKMGNSWPRIFQNAAAFPAEWYERHGLDPAQCMIIGIIGDAMEPTLPEGCLVMADRSRRRRRDGRIFALRTGDGLTIKRLGKDGNGKWVVASDNPNRAPETVVIRVFDTG